MPTLFRFEVQLTTRELLSGRARIAAQDRMRLRLIDTAFDGAGHMGLAVEEGTISAQSSLILDDDAEWAAMQAEEVAAWFKRDVRVTTLMPSDGGSMSQPP